MEKEFKNRVTLCLRHRSEGKPKDDVKIIQTKSYSSVVDVDANLTFHTKGDDETV